MSGFGRRPAGGPWRGIVAGLVLALAALAALPLAVAFADEDSVGLVVVITPASPAATHTGGEEPEDFTPTGEPTSWTGGPTSPGGAASTASSGPGSATGSASGAPGGSAGLPRTGASVASAALAALALLAAGSLVASAARRRSQGVQTASGGAWGPTGD
jgi:hypothetical protein